MKCVDQVEDRLLDGMGGNFNTTFVGHDLGRAEPVSDHWNAAGQHRLHHGLAGIGTRQALTL